MQNHEIKMFGFEIQFVLWQHSFLYRIRFCLFISILKKIQTH